MAPTKKTCYYCGRTDGQHTGGCMPDAPPDTEPQRSVRDIMREAVRVVEESTSGAVWLGPPFRTLTLADVGKVVRYRNRFGEMYRGRFVGFYHTDAEIQLSEGPNAAIGVFPRDHLVLVEGDPEPQGLVAVQDVKVTLPGEVREVSASVRVVNTPPDTEPQRAATSLCPPDDIMLTAVATVEECTRQVIDVSMPRKWVRHFMGVGISRGLSWSLVSPAEISLGAEISVGQNTYSVIAFGLEPETVFVERM